MCVRLPLKQNFSAHTESTHITSQNFIKILSNDPIKLIVNIMHQTNFPSQLDVFKKSIISHPFLMHFTPIIVSTKSLPPRPYHPVQWRCGGPSLGGGGGEEVCQWIPRNFFSSAQFQRKRIKAWSSFNL
jgi:hypothetical protein